MRIKEVQELTGITIKNIRFYEEMGLLQVKREKINRYRDYGEEQVERLMQIKLMRKLGVSLRTMKMVFDGELDFKSCLELRREEIREEKEQLCGMEIMCQELMKRRMELENLDAEQILEEIENQEKAGSHFINAAWDYITRGKNILPDCAFWFEPEEPILKPEEFTKELELYCGQKGKTLEFLHEGMEPVVRIDGKKYVCMLEHPRTVQTKGLLRILFPFFAPKTYGFKFVYVYPYQ